MKKLSEILETQFNFKLDLIEVNIFYRDTQNGENDVIIYLPHDDLYNLYLKNDSFEYINENRLLEILITDTLKK